MYSIREISEILNLPVPTVKTILRRALYKLSTQKELQNLHIDYVGEIKYYRKNPNDRNLVK